MRPPRANFFVPGVPVAKGSKTAFRTKRGGVVTVESNAAKQKPWFTAIQEGAKEAWRWPPSRAPIYLRVRFDMPRPKGHYGTGRNAARLKSSAPNFQSSRPDVDKLVRLVCDALKGIVYADDSQVAVSRASKVYAERPGVHVAVLELTDDYPCETDVPAPHH